MNPVLKELTPYYQLQYDRFNKVVSAEILMRSPLGNITDIVKDLEAANQIHQLDLLAFHFALKWYSKYRKPCASNFSGKSLNRKKIISAIAVEGCMSQIKIELTENRNLCAIAIANMKELSGIGFALSLDDYGSKYNGLNRLSMLPFREIKIDRFLIARIEDAKTRAIIKSTIELGKEIDCTVIAEGVEKRSQLNLLLGLGCDRFQGYLLHQPEQFLF